MYNFQEPYSEKHKLALCDYCKTTFYENPDEYKNNFLDLMDLDNGSVCVHMFCCTDCKDEYKLSMIPHSDYQIVGECDG